MPEQLEWLEELKQQTVEYLEKPRAGFVKGGQGRFGLANVLKTGEVIIADRFMRVRIPKINHGIMIALNRW